MDLHKISSSELLIDRAASGSDALWYEFAIQRGITRYSGGKVSYRLERNRQIIKTIDDEISRRKVVESAIKD